MRFSQTGEDFRTDQLASQFAGPALPIPAVYGIGQYGGRWWCISQRMPGVHLDDLSAGELDAAVPSLAAMLRAMRCVPAATTGYGGWDTYGNGQFETFADYLLDVADDTPGGRGSGWSVRLATQPRAQQVFDDALSTMREHVRFAPEARQLIHRDTLNYNVTVTGDRITGIFDWGCALWGDALYDLAWIRFCEWWYPQWSVLQLSDRMQAAVGAEGDNVSERLLCYLLHIGLGSISYNAMIENWPVMNDAVDATEVVLRAWT
jgi:hygromycin-B 4-O-kinase